MEQRSSAGHTPPRASRFAPFPLWALLAGGLMLPSWPRVAWSVARVAGHEAARLLGRPAASCLAPRTLPHSSWSAGVSPRGHRGSSVRFPSHHRSHRRVSRQRTSRPRRLPTRRPNVDFSSTKVNRSRDPLVFAATGGFGCVQFRGGLSAGRAGWSLSARVDRFRRTLRLWVTARQVDATNEYDVEDHDYFATIGEVPPGRYRLLVSHVYVPWEEEVAMSGIDIFERYVVVT